MFCPTCIIHTSLVALAPGTDVYRLPNNLITPCIDVFIELEHTFTSVATQRVEKAVVLTYDPELRRARCLPSPAFAKLVLVLHCAPVYGWGGVSRSRRFHASVPPVDDLSETKKDRCMLCQQDLKDEVVSDAQPAEVRFPIHITEWNAGPFINAPSPSHGERITSTIPPLSLDTTENHIHDPDKHTPLKPLDGTTTTTTTTAAAAVHLPTSNGNLCIPTPSPYFPTVPSFNSIQIQSTPPRKKASASAHGPTGTSLFEERRKFLNAVIMNSASREGLSGALAPSVSVECDVTECWVKDGSGRGG